MSIWTRLTEAIAALARGEGLWALFDRLRPATPPEKSVAFTIAVIALGAKMAKADGTVTRDEVTAFRRVFTLPPGEEAHAARVFNLARQDVAGFELYASRIAAMFPGDEGRPVLTDLMEVLFAISMADGAYHAAEDAFLAEVARRLNIGEPCFRAIRARFVPDTPHDPYGVLGIPPTATLEEARAAWRAAVMDTHPDRMLARGVPQEALRLAERRLIAVNAAWEAISGKRAA